MFFGDLYMKKLLKIAQIRQVYYNFFFTFFAGRRKKIGPVVKVLSTKVQILLTKVQILLGGEGYFFILQSESLEK